MLLKKYTGNDIDQDMVVYDAVNLMKCAEIILAMTVEVLKEMTDAYSLFINKVRPHVGQEKYAENFYGSTYCLHRNET